MQQKSVALSLGEENPKRFDLLITDQTMPQLLGSDMIKKIWELNPDIPAILATGYSDTMSRDQAEKLGIHYMDKPIDMAHLQATIARLFSNSERL